MKTLLSQRFDKSFYAHYLIIIRYLDPVQHPVGVNILHAFGSPHGIPCPCLGNGSVAAFDLKLDDLHSTKRVLAGEQESQCARYQQEHRELRSLHYNPPRPE